MHIYFMFRRLVHSVVPLNKLKFTFVKSSGPGGQNVNKTNSKAQACVDLNGGWLSAEHIEAIKSKYKVNEKGQLIIQRDTYRTQLQNQQSCHAKLNQILSEAEEACKPAIGPSSGQMDRVERLKEKFVRVKKELKIKLKDKKSSRSMKNHWSQD